MLEAWKQANLFSGQFFLGESSSSVLDPALGGFGKSLCTQLVVREAADRLTTLIAARRQLIAQPAQPCRPAIWEDDCEVAELDPRGLRAREIRWCRELVSRGSGEVGPERQGDLEGDREGGISKGREPGWGTAWILQGGP